MQADALLETIILASLLRVGLILLKPAPSKSTVENTSGFGDLRRDLIITKPTLPTSAEVYPFLKHGIYRRFLLPGTAAVHDTLHRVVCRFSLVRCPSRVSPLISILLRQSTINKDLTIFTVMRKDIKTYLF